jgi:hypothetical protein
MRNAAKAEIMSPYDAVPAAALYLCRNGAGRGGQALGRRGSFQVVLSAGAPDARRANRILANRVGPGSSSGI